MRANAGNPPAAKISSISGGNLRSSTLVPLATWYQLASRVRDIAEHALASEDDDPLRNTRTVLAGFLILGVAGGAAIIWFWDRITA